MMVAYERPLRRCKQGMQIWVPRGKFLLWLTWRCIAELGLDTVDLSKNTVDLSRDTVDLAATVSVRKIVENWVRYTTYGR
jgi:hypothetical protein